MLLAVGEGESCEGPGRTGRLQRIGQVRRYVDGACLGIELERDLNGVAGSQGRDQFAVGPEAGGRTTRRTPGRVSRHPGESGRVVKGDHVEHCMRTSCA